MSVNLSSRPRKLLTLSSLRSVKLFSKRSASIRPVSSPRMKMSFEARVTQSKWRRHCTSSTNRGWYWPTKRYVTSYRDLTSVRAKVTVVSTSAARGAGCCIRIKMEWVMEAIRLKMSPLPSLSVFPDALQGLSATKIRPLLHRVVPRSNSLWSKRPPSSRILIGPWGCSVGLNMLRADSSRL